MNADVGLTDRRVRFAIGLVLVLVAIVTQQWWLLALAAIALVTAALRFCPLWVVLRVNTLKKAVKGQ